MVDPGAYIPAGGAPLVTLMDLSKVRVRVPVPEPEVPLIANGLPVKVAVEENDGNIGLLDKTLRAEVPAELKDDFEKYPAIVLAGAGLFSRSRLWRRSHA